MEKIRLGTIGSGVIVESILDQVVKTEGIRLTAVYSRSKEKGSALAKLILDMYGLIIGGAAVGQLRRAADKIKAANRTNVI